jgi:predicted nucleotidyltransferase
MLEQYNINQTTLKILGLYRSNYRMSLHLREIARETDVDVKAIQLQLKRLEKINVLSGTIKGRNKEYCLNLGNSIIKYYMILAETLASINYLGKNFAIKKLVGEIGDRIGDVAILFGSFVKGEITEESDIDLFVITEKKPDLSVVRAAGSLIDREISVKSANKKQFLKGLMDGDPLTMEIVSNHIILEGVDDFCNMMWRCYAGR